MFLQSAAIAHLHRPIRNSGRWIKRIPALVLTGLLFAHGNVAAHAADAAMGGQQAPVASILKADGSLDLTTGFSGSLDVTGHRVVTRADGAPAFVKADAPAGNPDDVYWDDRFTLPGINGEVRVVVVDAAGNVYIAGGFNSVGSVVAKGIAKWDGTSWSSLGSGIGGSLYALAVSGTNVYVGGYFSEAGGVAANNVAVWNGTSWAALDSGMPGHLKGTDGQVKALAFLGSDLYAGGGFTSAGGVSAMGIAKWNGSVWSTVGGGLSDSGVYALAVDGNDLYVGGSFGSAGGVQANGIAKWDGSTWSAFGTGVAGSMSTVHSIVVSGESVYIAGDFSTAGGIEAANIARWDGSAWGPLGGGLNWAADCMIASGGDLIVGGGFSTAGGVPVEHIAKWDGSVWAALGTGVDRRVRAIAVRGSDLIVCGDFVRAGGNPATGVARWNGTGWSALAAPGFGIDWAVHAVAIGGNAVYVGGDFLNAGDIRANNIAKWDGTTWTALGDGVDGGVGAIAVSGTLVYAGGSFSSAGGVEANHIACWDGVSWSALGGGVVGQVRAIAVGHDGVYVGGAFRGGSLSGVAKWDGTQWSALGTGVEPVTPFWPVFGVNAIAVDGKDVYVAGDFSIAGGTPASNIAKWDGSAWSTMGAGLGVVDTLVVSRGKVYAGGRSIWSDATGKLWSSVCSWDGSSWTPLDAKGVNTNHIFGLAAHGNKVYATGSFSRLGDSDVAGVAMFNGTSWVPLGSGSPGAQAIAVRGRTVYLGGCYLAGGKPSADFAVWQPKVRITNRNEFDDGLLVPGGSGTGWSQFGMSTETLGWAVGDTASGALRAYIAATQDHYRVSGAIGNRSDWIPYSSVGTGYYVRARFHVYSGGQADPDEPEQIPNMRLRVQTRFAQNSMLEVYNHLNSDPEATLLSQDFRPSDDPQKPSVYRVDFDPVDVPFLLANGATEGVQPAFEAYSTDPQDNGYLALTEVALGVYPAAFLGSDVPLKVYATTATDAGDLQLVSAGDHSCFNYLRGLGEGEFGTAVFTGSLPTTSQDETGVTIDTRSVPADLIGIGIVNINPDRGTNNHAERVRVEEGQQYRVRFHLTSTQSAGRQAQIRLRARTAKFNWAQKTELGGAWSAGPENNTIAQQLLPGVGCLNPDKDGNETGGWYTLLMHTPLDSAIRPEFAPEVPVSVRMPNLSAQPGPGVASPSRRDLLVGFDVIDTLSQTTLHHLEQGLVTLDRVEIYADDFMPD